MNDAHGIVDLQTDALLRRVAREQETRCRRARESAEEQARTIVQRARTEARARLRQAAREERRSIEQTLADRRAARDTEARRRSQVAARAIIDEAWSRLPAALAETWREREARERWCRAACAAATAALPAGLACAVEVDDDSPADVERTVLSALGERTGALVEFKRLGGLGAGLRIRAGRACLDATVAGLLVARERIESELLAEIERHAGHAPESSQ
jgi:hypothetical protein